MKVLVDGDVIAYRCAWSSNEETEDEALDKVDALMDDVRFATAVVEDDIKVFLTGKGNFRYEVDSDYKANRRDVEKPVHLKAIRDHLIDNWLAVVSEGEEADDMIAQEAHALGYKCIIASIDKDFLQLPCRHYNFNKGEWSFQTEWDAKVFFYTQILTGDKADNVQGIYGIGPKKAEKLLSECKTEEDLLTKVVDAYEGKGGYERMLVVANLLWLRREKGVSWVPPAALP